MLNWLPWLLMMKRPGHKFSRRMVYAMPKKQASNGQCLDSDNLLINLRHHSEDGSFTGFNNSTTRATTEVDEKPLGRVHRKHSPELESRLVTCLRNVSSSPHQTDQGLMSMLLTMQQVYSEVKFIAQRMEREDEVQEAKNDWRFVSLLYLEA